MNFKIKIPKLRKIKNQYFKKKKTRKLKKPIRRQTKGKTSKRQKNTLYSKRRISAEEKEGADLGKLATTLWKLQSKPGKVYVVGKRIHHGLFGTALTLWGAYTNDKKLQGFGKALLYDDIDDLPNWLNFEDGHNYSNGYAQSNINELLKNYENSSSGSGPNI